MLYTMARLSIVLVVALAAAPAAAFAGPATTTSAASLARHVPLCLSAEASALPCAQPSATEGIIMNDVRVTGATLRATELADVRGARVPVSSVVGEQGKAVIVFLRHLG